MLLKNWKLFGNERFNDALVDTSAEHVLEVVDWHKVFNYASKCPICFFLSHYLEQAANYKVETLAVTYVSISIGICSTDALDRIQHLLAKLLLQSVLSLFFFLVVPEASFIWKGSRHVNFNLMSVDSWVVRVDLTY